MQLLTTIIEPQRLLLSWQKSEGNAAPYNAGGVRYIVGELTRESASGEIHLRYFLNQPAFAEAVACGFEGYPAFNTSQAVHTHDVMAAFSRRVPSKSRGDFAEYLDYWRISYDAGKEMTPFALLGYTGGILPGDGFNLIHTFEEAVPPCEFVIEAAGVRHYPHVMDMIERGTLQGSEVRFENESDSAHDPHAVKILLGDGLLGYVKRGQTTFFNQWLGRAQLHAHVERVNGRREKPCVLIYIRAKQ